MARTRLEEGSSNPVEILTKKYGKGILQAQEDVRWLSTGIPALDHFISGKEDEGGLPRGRLIEIYGPESCGKSTLAMCIAGSVLKAGETVLWDDLERAWTTAYGARFGASEEHGTLMVIQPPTIEAAMDAILITAPYAKGGLSIIDSLAAGMPKFMEGKGIGEDKSVGSVSRAVGASLQQIIGPIAQYDHTVLIVNQMRTKFEANFAVGETTTGGWSLRHYASLRLKLRRKGVKEKQWQGRPVRVIEAQMRIMKTKVADNEGAEIDIWVVPQMGVRVAAPRTPLSE